MGSQPINALGAAKTVCKPRAVSSRGAAQQGLKGLLPLFGGLWLLDHRRHAAHSGKDGRREPAAGVAICANNSNQSAWNMLKPKEDRNTAAKQRAYASPVHIEGALDVLWPGLALRVAPRLAHSASNKRPSPYT